jgi:hypothetical protein
MNPRRFLRIAIVFAIIFPASSVSEAAKIPSHKEIKTGEDSIIISWSAPNHCASEISYRLYFRGCKTADTAWKFLGITADTSFSVSYEKISKGGLYIFGVSGYYEEFRTQTGMHTSLDSTAIPKIGWHLAWNKEDAANPLVEKVREEKYVFFLNPRRMPSLRTEIIPKGIHVVCKKDARSSEEKGVFSRWTHWRG